MESCSRERSGVSATLDLKGLTQKLINYPCTFGSRIQLNYAELKKASCLVVSKGEQNLATPERRQVPAIPGRDMTPLSSGHGRGKPKTTQVSKNVGRDI